MSVFVILSSMTGTPYQTVDGVFRSRAAAEEALLEDDDPICDFGNLFREVQHQKLTQDGCTVVPLDAPVEPLDTPVTVYNYRGCSFCALSIDGAWSLGRKHAGTCSDCEEFELE